jgi:hypothetical protein
MLTIAAMRMLNFTFFGGCIPLWVHPVGFRSFGSLRHYGFGFVYGI